MMIWHSSEAQEVLKELNSDSVKGLANGVADMRLEQYGKNAITSIRKPSFLKRFLSQINNKYVYILIVSAIISFIISAIYDENGLLGPWLIIGIVVLNALISAFHLFRGDNALNNIKSITNPQATVIRDGKTRQIESCDLVPGDIILLSEGDYITADARVIEDDGFRCNELSLSGDSIPVEKRASAVLEDITPITERSNMVYTGCSVVHGSAKAVVVETGLNTEIGHTSALLQQTGADRLPMQDVLDNTGRIVNIIILIICAVVFALGILQNFTADSFANMTAKTFLNSVALAICAIPEGLPAISTIVIALGIKRIINDDIIIKKTEAIETLGRTTVICSDKTGVLTRNKMHLECIFDGETVCHLGKEQISDKNATTLSLAAACSTLENDATENAIKAACEEYSRITLEDVSNIFPRLDIIPFDFERKSMTSINMINGKPVAIVKGAAEIVVDKCIDCDKKAILEMNEQLTKKALRVVCIAVRQLDEIPANPNAQDIESELVFAGLLGIKDPPRKDAENGIEICRNAGIKTVMITGDNLDTAVAVAKKLGILTDESGAVTGATLEEMDDEALNACISDYTVFARVSPDDKLRIIKAFKAIGETVAVTGDSVSDSEALAEADIGCAMGESGADVAKGSADIIITNNNFFSVVRAIRESRGMFVNIRNAALYLLSCNFGEIIAYLAGMLIFKVPPIAAVPLLWINLLTDCAPAMALSIDKPQDDVMCEQPQAMFRRMLSVRATVSTALQAVYIAAITLIAFKIGLSHGYSVAATMAFSTLGLTQIIHAFNIRAGGTVFKTKFSINDYLGVSTVITIFAMLFMVLTPAGFAFGLEILSGTMLVISAALAASVVLFCEGVKCLLAWIIRKKS